ncbi:MAG: twin-arginine translocation signal domain-containing protein, partial [Bacteroidales bacterium]|nr:twin-arginine translocation signal domain-containing protein [Bacteroidales bacterium]
MEIISRRKFLKSTALTGAGLIVAPTIVPSHVFGANAPSERINVGAIGTGRQGQGFDMPGIMKFDVCN